MGTRSKIFVTSYLENKTYLLYKHSGGYPTGNFPTIIQAYQKMVMDHDQVKIDLFLEEIEKIYKEGMKEMESSAIGLDMIFESDYTFQGDLEFIYHVDLDNKNVDIFEGNGDEIEIISSGKYNYKNWIDNIRDEYKEEEKNCMAYFEKDFYENNFTINQSDTYEVERRCVKKLKEEMEKQRDEYWDLRNKQGELERSRDNLLKELFSIGNGKSDIDSKDLKIILNVIAKNYSIENVRKSKYGYNITYKELENDKQNLHDRWSRYDIEHFCNLLGLKLSEIREQ